MSNLKLALKGLMVCGFLTMALPATHAFAQDANVLRDSIRQYQTRVDVLNGESTSRYNGEMSQIKSWIDESLILIGKDELKKVHAISEKLDVYIDFVEAAVARDKAMSAAMEAESKLKALKAEYGKLDAQVQQLTAEEALMTEKLNAMQKKQ